jgi:hypothetical protein
MKQNGCRIASDHRKDESRSCDELDDSLIEQIWHDLDGQVTREQIRQVVTEIAAEFRSATVTAFVPIFIRRQAREKLENTGQHGLLGDADGYR